MEVNLLGQRNLCSIVNVVLGLHGGGIWGLLGVYWGLQIYRCENAHAIICVSTLCAAKMFAVKTQMLPKW